MVVRILLLLIFVIAGAGCTSAASRGESTDAGDPICRSDDACGDDEVCVNGSCRPMLPCDATTCGLGVCDRNTGECVNADPCDPELGDAQCLRGYFCHEGECLDDSLICWTLDCDRGLCDEDQRRCVPPESCVEDQQCLEGQTCFENECVFDHCEPNPCRSGQCSLSLGGACVNAERCLVADDCLEGWDCHNDRCVSAPCDRFCPGRQVCTSPPVGTGATCSESPEGCFTASDCLGDRVCISYGCSEPLPCVPEASEPNDDVATATPISVPFAPAEAVVVGTLCATDIDYFMLDTSAQPADTTITIDLSIPEELQGVTSFTLDVLDSDGRSLGSTSGEDPGPLRITRGSAETLFIEVGADEPKAGEYSLVVALDPPTELLNCDSQIRSGEKRRASPQLSSAVTSTCGWEKTGAAGYWFELDRTQVVEVGIWSYILSETPAVVISEACGVGVTNLDCESRRSTSDGGVHVRELLPPGTYFISVEADPDANGGFGHVIVFDTYDPLCNPGHVTCVNSVTAQVCGSDGVPQLSFHCDDGCDASSNTCNDVPTDSCLSALPIDDGYTGLIDWGLLDDEFRPDGYRCGDDYISGGEGVDAVFEVVLEPGERLSATLHMGNERGSLYVLDECIDSKTCRAGARGTGTIATEFVNTSLRRNTVYLVADRDYIVHSTTPDSLITLQKW